MLPFLRRIFRAIRDEYQRFRETRCKLSDADAKACEQAMLDHRTKMMTANARLAIQKTIAVHETGNGRFGVMVILDGRIDAQYASKPTFEEAERFAKLLADNECARCRKQQFGE